MRIRIKFRKNGVMRFIGHLDIMRFFQKAIRRAGLDVAYSEGFSPHQIMSFAAPLGVGVTSDGEYLDIEVISTGSSAESMAALNAAMVEGMEVTSYVALRQNAKKAMTAVAAADYIVYFKKREDFSQDGIRQRIREYYENRETIEITKQSKKSERVIDVKPLIYRFEAYEDSDSPVMSDSLAKDQTVNSTSGFEQDGRPSSACSNLENEISEFVLSDLGTRRGFFLRLSTGSTDNIKPELVLQDFYAYFGKDYDPFNMQIHRLEVYERAGDDLLPLDAAGDIIT
ncbi:MAG: TIGR03936 family radical SAM-associated protein [Lachnospiraceae bacterium]|nr:TIGR03936 family radical SAM-associated protein [Lachnospiraceae bacterium]